MSARILTGPWTGDRARNRDIGRDRAAAVVPVALSSRSSAEIIDLGQYHDTARVRKASLPMAAAPCATHDANNAASGSSRCPARFETSELVRSASGGDSGFDPALRHGPARVCNAMSPGARAASDLAPGHAARRDGLGPGRGLAEFMAIASGAAAGHDSEGIDRNGRKWLRPTDDPAVAVGLALHFVEKCAPRGLPIPAAVLHHLDRHAAEGDATARLVRDWIEKRSVWRDGRQQWLKSGGHVL